MRHGSKLDPPNRFDKTVVERDWEQLEWDTEFLQEFSHRPVEYLTDNSKSIVSENQSPDIPFRYSLNPYRGCVHACAYCYARPGHEYLGYNAGLDFETKIVVKHNAAQLFRQFLSRKSYQPESVMFSGVTDCYQPAERQFRLTRACLEVALECKQPVCIITKNALVLRDLDLLTQLAAHNLVHVFLSITTLNPELARDMEPRTSIPTAKLRAVRELSTAQVPTGVMVAPLIPGLNDSEIPAILQASQEAGALTANYVLLRLPLTVAPVFKEWLERTQPLKAEMILGRIKETRGGQLYDSSWGQRGIGSGLIAQQIGQMFSLFKKKNGLTAKLDPLNCNLFERPDNNPRQLRLF